MKKNDMAANMATLFCWGSLEVQCLGQPQTSSKKLEAFFKFRPPILSTIPTVASNNIVLG